MRLKCEQCGSEIPAEDINITTAIAKCRRCDEVFSFAAQLPQAKPQSAGRPRVDAPQPSGVVVEVNGGRMRILRRWYFGGVVGLLAFCLAWDSFLIWMIPMFARGQVHTPGPPLLFFAPFVVAGVAMTWYTLAVLLNRTIIESDGTIVQFHHRPVPWRRGGSINADEIEQVYCQALYGSSSASQLNSVSMRMHDGRKVIIAPMIQDSEQALYIEQELERFLGIEDQHVPGEIKA